MRQEMFQLELMEQFMKEKFVIAIFFVIIGRVQAINCYPR